MPGLVVRPMTAQEDQRIGGLAVPAMPDQADLNIPALADLRAVHQALPNTMAQAVLLILGPAVLRMPGQEALAIPVQVARATPALGELGRTVPQSASEWLRSTTTHCLGWLIGRARVKPNPSLKLIDDGMSR